MNNAFETNHYWMQQAIALARKASAEGEVPVGALVVMDDHVIGEGWNSPIQLKDPSAHAEIVAIRQAAKTLDNYRLIKATLYVTLEPCMMCAAAMVHARIGRLVFGAFDVKAGAVGSQINVLTLPWLNHRIEVIGGVMTETCGQLLTQFFQERRK